ncbi:cytochrome p450 94b1 [Nicotiana attenuata]|uniref:Cytochrome p450 94b1 n=2 Tax=Nicotiana attenuata TaxID=49451 RepID=A0A314L5Y1_NICAT|nr:cytochrome p450 94b1 [Nicotiana attenuata]
MADIDLFFYLFTFFVILICAYLSRLKQNSFQSATNSKSYPFKDVIKNRHRLLQWTCEIFESSSTTINFHGPFGGGWIFTTNPSNIQHIFKTRIDIYQKGKAYTKSMADVLGDGIFVSNCENWKTQKHLLNHYLNQNAHHKFVESITRKKLFDNMVPILSTFAANETIFDLQKIIRRLMYDLAFQIALDFDLKYLSPALPETVVADAFERALEISFSRYLSIPVIWKAKRFLNQGTERELKLAINQVRCFIEKIMMEKKENNSSAADFCSKNQDLGEKFLVDEILNFLLASQGTISSALTWFFWLLSQNSNVEAQIIKEIKEKHEESRGSTSTSANNSMYKRMVYTHASLCESMRLFPPVPSGGMDAMQDDVLPDGTIVKKGMSIMYNAYAMGRSQELWGSDYMKFRPERWLERDVSTGEWCFVSRPSFAYPVFQAGLRICLGRESAFLQMKMVVCHVLRRFKVVPAVKGVEPVQISFPTLRMKEGFPVRIVERC